VHLTVADLARSLAYYREQIGLDVFDRAPDRARLGAGGDELVVLVEEPGARPPRNATGLYHFALLLPTRVGLARWLAHAARDRVPLVGLSDHFVSEATLPQRSESIQDRDLLGPAASSGRAGEGEDDDAPLDRQPARELDDPPTERPTACRTARR
jgi:hypothetical protein